MDIESGSEDSYIFDVCYILTKQKHITEKELMECENGLIWKYINP